MAPGLFDQALPERVARTHGMLDCGLDAEFDNSLPHLFGGRLWLHRLSDADGHAERERFRPAEARLAVAATEDAAPQVVEMDRDDRRVRPLGDLLKPLVEGLDGSVRRESALREDADQPALLQGFACAGDGLDQGARAVARMDLDDVRDAEERTAPAPA